MKRREEPELMLSPEQARAYSEADFSEPHQAAADRFVHTFPDVTSGRALDLGCGPADVTVRLARAVPGLTITGIDGSEAMLTLGRERVAEAGLTDRITLECRRIGDPDLGTLGPVDVVVSTSVLHHLHDPMTLWRAVRQTARPGAVVFVVDLMRPDGERDLDRLTEQYVAHEHPVLQHDFQASLAAAFTVDEVREQLRAAGLALRVEAISDRHLVASGHR